MSKRLDELKKNFDESRKVAAGLNKESADLKAVLARKQEQVMETVREDLREFAGYASGLSKGWHKLFLEDCTLDFYKSSYGRSPNLIVAFEPDGDVKIKGNPSGYGHLTDIYELNRDSWGWYSDKCKAYITENWGFISEQIEEALAKDLERAAKNVVDVAVQNRDELQVSIGEVAQNIDWGKRKDAVLYNAISLLMDEAYGDEGFADLLDELGVTMDELEAMGIQMEKPLSRVLDDANLRANEGSDKTGKDVEKECF